MVDFKTLEAVVWIDRLGGFRLAAERLNTTQPALSHRIQQLERELGVEIFTRQKPKVVITNHGRELVRYAHHLLSVRQKMILSIASSDHLSYNLRLGVVETISCTWLPEFLKEISCRFPRTFIEMEVNDSPTLKNKLASSELDIIFVAGSIDAASGVSVSLSSSPVRFVCAPTLILPSNPTLKDLADCGILTFSNRSQMRPMLNGLFHEFGVPRPRFHASTSIQTIVHMALDGIGVALIPTVTVEKQLDAGELVALDGLPALPDMTFRAMWLKASETNVLTQAGRLAEAISGGTPNR